MEIKHITAGERERWDAFVAKEPSFALLQSWDWGRFKEKLGWKASRIAVLDRGEIVAGAQMLIKPLPTRLASVAYIPRGPIGNWLEGETAALLFAELHRIARLNRSIFLKIEPPLLNNPAIDQILKRHHFQPSLIVNQPRATIILDLSKDLDGIMSQMRKKTRQYIRSVEREGVTVRIGSLEDLPAFTDLMQLTSQRKKFSSRSRFYYEQEWKTFHQNNQVALLMAYYQNKLSDVRMIFRFGKHAAQFHSGASREFGKMPTNNLLAWEAIKWAKAQGSTTDDLWGIPEEVGQTVFEGNEPPVTDRTDGLWGVYRFKSGFSKNIVYYVGAYDYVYTPLVYRLMTVKPITSGTFERVSARMDLWQQMFDTSQ